jgi:hypothetical protein
MVHQRDGGAAPVSACRIGFYVPATWLGLGNQPIQRQLVSGGGLFVHND